MRNMLIHLGVPKLGIIKEIYDFDSPSDCSALNLNVANGCMVLGMEEMKTLDQEDIIKTDSEEQATIKRSNFEVITGGKEPPNGEESEWLSSLRKGTVFLAKLRDSPSDLSDLFEYGVLRKTKKAILVILRQTSGETIHWVDPKSFCRRFNCFEVIYIPAKEETDE